jgi:hypothetical protein
MSPAGWQQRLNDVFTKEGVVEVVHDFLAHWPREEITKLEADCKPGRMVHPDDVNTYALKLAYRHTLETGDTSAMHRMATFFTRAALRIFELEDGFSGRDRDPRGSDSSRSEQ